MDGVLRLVLVGVALVVALILGVLAVGVVLGVGADAQEPASVATESVAIRYQPEDEVTVPLIVDELAPDTVLTIRASGFEADVTGIIRQCVAGTPRRCDNQLPVRFDSGGGAAFQYLVSNRVGGGEAGADGCRLGGARCTIELTSGSRTSVVETIFIDAAPEPGTIRVESEGALVVGDTVLVALSGFPSEASLLVTVCAAPATSGSRCGAPGPEVPVTIGSDGGAEVEVVLDVDEVGSDGVACGRRSACRLVVSSEEVGVRANPVTIPFADGPGADYEASSVVIGVALAAGFLALAAWLVRSTNWDPPREADSSAIDEAEFADLDREAAEFEEAERAGVG